MAIEAIPELKNRGHCEAHAQTLIVVGNGGFSSNPKDVSRRVAHVDAAGGDGYAAQ